MRFVLAKSQRKQMRCLFNPNLSSEAIPEEEDGAPPENRA
jgi:hypothetical protein